jgi:hypothetical protein
MTRLKRPGFGQDLTNSIPLLNTAITLLEAQKKRIFEHEDVSQTRGYAIVKEKFELDRIFHNWHKETRGCPRKLDHLR